MRKFPKICQKFAKKNTEKKLLIKCNNKTSNAEH